MDLAELELSKPTNVVKAQANLSGLKPVGKIDLNPKPKPAAPPKATTPEPKAEAPKEVAAPQKAEAAAPVAKTETPVKEATPCVGFGLTKKNNPRINNIGHYFRYRNFKEKPDFNDLSFNF